jgi:PHD/YefM family antitoxin component YafN of YafNO toxin-antitoxin module
MNRLTILEAQQKLLDLPDQLTAEPTIITQDGQPVMALMSYDQLTSMLETLDILTNSEFANLLQRSITQANQADTICWDEATAALDA